MDSKLYRTLSSIRYALSVGVAVGIATFINAYAGFSNEPWMILSAFFVSTASHGRWLRHGMLLFLLMSVIILFATLIPTKTPLFIQNRIIDVLFGAMIGITCGQLISPIKAPLAFCMGVLPILRALDDYSHTLTTVFLAQENNRNVVAEKRFTVDQAFGTQHGIYPEWVYAVGFNPGLRSGFRFFLVKLDQITEILFSLEYLLTRDIERSFLQDLNPAISHSMKINQALLVILIEYLEHQQRKDIEFDLTHDIIELEATLHRIIPKSIELFDLSPSYLILSAWVRSIKDLRELLLQLVMSLPIGS